MCLLVLSHYLIVADYIFAGQNGLLKFISLVNEKNDAVVIIVVIALRSSAIENYILIIGEYSTCII